MQDFLQAVLDALLYVTGWPLACVLILGGLYFTVRTGFVQLRMFAETFRVIFEKPKDKKSVSSFGALMISTASRVGTGNIIGVSTAILIFFGASMKMGLAWDVADIAQCILAFINIPVCIAIGGVTYRALDHYIQQRKNGVNPEFKAADINIPHATEFWIQESGNAEQ